MVIKTASPGVTINEFDLTRGTSDAITTNVGGFAGPFARGPVDELVLVQTEAELQRTFGDPNEKNYEFWYTVANFLEYGGICYVVRCDDDVQIMEGDQRQIMKNACTGGGGTTVYIKNYDDFVENWLLNSNGETFMARTPGTWANGLAVAVIDSGADSYVKFDMAKANVIPRNFINSADSASPDPATLSYTPRWTCSESDDPLGYELYTTDPGFNTNCSGNHVGKYLKVIVDEATVDPTIPIGSTVFQVNVNNPSSTTTPWPCGYVTGYTRLLGPPDKEGVSSSEYHGVYEICQFSSTGLQGVDFYINAPQVGPDTKLQTTTASLSSGVITGIQWVGNYELYSEDGNASNEINVIFKPQTFTASQVQTAGWATDTAPAAGSLAGYWDTWPVHPRPSQQFVTYYGTTFYWDANTQLWTAYKQLSSTDVLFDAVYGFKVSLTSSWYDRQIAFAEIPWNRFAQRPVTTQNAAEKGASNDGMNVIIYDMSGNYTGTKGNTIAQFPGVSKLKGAQTPEGGSNYYVDIINNFSNTIYTSGVNLIGSPQTGLNASKSPVGTTIADGVECVYIRSKSYDLKKGVDNFSASLGELMRGYDKFTTENVEDLDYILQGPAGDSEFSFDPDDFHSGDAQVNTISDCIAKANYLISIAESRRDCISFISPPRQLVVGQSNADKVTDTLEDYYDNLTSSSYAVFDSGYKYMYDRFSDEYKYVPMNADVAGCMVRSSILAEPWYSPAGLARGQVFNIVKLAYNPSKAQRDQLYTSRVNPIVTFPGEGTVLFGDKTALSYSSAFDRINVRKLFLVIEREIAKMSRVNLFEFNDEVTRTLFKNNVNPFLRDVQAKRGVTDFLVVCDETNNTPEVVDRNEFVADIYVKPARSINFITLNFVATKTGVAFDESVALFRRPNS